MGLSANVAAIELLDDEVRLAVVQAGKVVELHRCSVRPPASALTAIEDAEAPAEEERAAAQAEVMLEARVEAVRAVVKQMRTRPATHILCVPGQRSVVRLLTIPFRGRRRVAAAVQFELEPYLAFPIEELVVDFLTVKERKGETEVLAVGVRRDYLSQQLAVLEEAGVDPEGIGLTGIGLTALWLKGRRRPKGLNALVHLGEGGAILAILNGKNLVYLRHLALSPGNVRENPTVLVREVRNSVRAFLAGWDEEGELGGLSVTGLALFEEERALLEEELRIPVQQDDLFEGMKGIPRALRFVERHEPEHAQSGVPTSSDRSTGAPWAATIGTALAAGGAPFWLNFRKGELAWPQVTRTVVGHLVFSSCLALLVLLGIAWYFHEEHNENKVQIGLLRARIADILDEVDQMREQSINVSPAMFRDPPLLDILAELGDTMPDSKVRITALKVNEPDERTDDWVTVAGEVKNEAVFADVVDKLKRSPMFRMDDEPDYRMEGGKSTFRIRLKRPAPGVGSIEEEPEDGQEGSG